MNDQPIIEAGEEEEELTGFDLILSENPQSYDEDAAKALYDNQAQYWDDNTDEFWDSFEDSYQGEYSSDEDFAQEMAESMGFKASRDWPASCIDWEFAAKELMYDYFEENGYYFRSL